jgi:hypothetical protein
LGESPQIASLPRPQKLILSMFALLSVTGFHSRIRPPPISMCPSLPAWNPLAPGGSGSVSAWRRRFSGGPVAAQRLDGLTDHGESGDAKA